MIDNKEYARQLRTNAAKDENGVIRCSPELWEEIARIIENSEEVVKCKDCIHLKHSCLDNEPYCKIWGDKCGDYCDFNADTEPDNYCGYGKRKASCD